MELNIEKLESMSTDEISHEIDKLEKEAKLADDALVTVLNRDTELSLKMLDLQRDRKQLRIVIDQGKYNVRSLARCLAAAKRIYWRVKG